MCLVRIFILTHWVSITSIRFFIDLSLFLSLSHTHTHSICLCIPFFWVCVITEELPEGFEIASRETEADRTGETRTLERKLPLRLYFCVQNEDTDRWGFPTTELEEDETLLAAAKRIVTDTAGARCEFYHTSNSPMAVDMEIYDEERRQAEGVFGVKTFFMKLTHDEGDVENLQRAADFGWLDREEMTEKAREQEGVNCGKFYYYML